MLQPTHGAFDRRALPRWLSALLSSRLDPEQRRLHLLAALLTLGLLIVAGVVYARWVESRAVHALASRIFTMKTQGSALQAEAFRQPDLLVVYGSSEIVTFPGPFRADELFQDAPSGFSTFPIGSPGTNAMIVLQDLAAVADEIRGKKVVICVSPLFFRTEENLRSAYYQNNFSLLHASEVAFSTRLSFGLKQAIARQMLDYPNTLKNAPLLRFALQRLASGSTSASSPTRRCCRSASCTSWSCACRTTGRRSLPSARSSPSRPRRPLGSATQDLTGARSRPRLTSTLGSIPAATGSASTTSTGSTTARSSCGLEARTETAPTSARSARCSTRLTTS